MGVNGLWQVIQPCARPTNLATLNRKRLAVDASIWIYQFLKAMRDKDGNAMHNGHIVGFFRRICKLLYHGVLPVFVFDGGAPVLKRSTIQGRKKRREGRRDDAARTASKLLVVQMQRLAEEEEEQRKKGKRTTSANMSAKEDPVTAIAVPAAVESAEEPIPDANNLVYVDEIGLPQQQRQLRRFQKEDAYHLPELPGDITTMGKPEDPRIMSIEELEEYARQFNSGEDINLYDFSKIDFDGDFFKSLPPADRYNILNAARLRSRLRMGVSKDHLDSMFPDRMAFSKFQIERVKERNRLTQRLMLELGMNGTDLTLSGRIASEKDREYILVKNDGAEGGWALGVVSRNKSIGNVDNPIDVDQIDVQFQGAEEDDSDEEEEFEDIPVEGVNRLPKPRPGWTATAYMAEQARAMGASIQELYGVMDEKDDSLFVEDTSNQTNEQLGRHEQEELERAIAMSLENQFGLDPYSETLESPPPDGQEAPSWVQKAVPAPKPITTTTNGSMLAHIVNNRAIAQVKAAEAFSGASQPIPAYDKRVNEDDSDGSSDSELDFGAALASAARKRQQQGSAAPLSRRPASASFSSGPLPFEALDWKKSVFTIAKEQQAAKSYGQPLALPSLKQHQGPLNTETATFEVHSDSDEDGSMSGGFIKPKAPKTQVDKQVANSDGVHQLHSDASQLHSDAPQPPPPWFAANTNIVQAMQASRAAESKRAAEYNAFLESEASMDMQSIMDETIHIQSSEDDGSDVKIIEPQDFMMKTTNANSSVDAGMAEKNVLSSATADKLPSTSTINDDSPAEEIMGKERKDSSQKSTEEVAPSMTHDMLSGNTNVQATPVVAPVSLPAETKDEVSDAEDVEFEDVEIQQPGSVDFQPAVIHPPTVSGPSVSAFNVEEEEDIFAGVEAPAVAAMEADVEPDTDEEELLAQLAEEAEAHETFATTLNYKRDTERAPPLIRVDIEKEIAALRQQKQKEQRDADEVNQIMIAEAQSLLRLFGIPYITAPMEAEAQCAELVRLNLVDGIVTDDSDTFLFGGARVYKNMFNGRKFVECYLAADLDREMSLSREQLIALAQLLGSDYAEGLPGIGPVTAVELLAEFPGPNSLVQFRDWWTAVQSSGKLPAEDAENKFRKKFRRTYGKKLFLPPGFPSDAVAEAYMHPQVDDSSEQFVWGLPDLAGLRQFLMSTVGWSPEKADEVLVPVIRDMNKRAVEGTQSNITRFFSMAPRAADASDDASATPLDPGAGGEVFGPRQRAQGVSKRMAQAVVRLRSGIRNSTAANAEIANVDRSEVDADVADGDAHFEDEENPRDELESDDQEPTQLSTGKRKARKGPAGASSRRSKRRETRTG